VTARPRLVDQHELLLEVLAEVLAEVRALRADVQGLLRARAALDAGRAKGIAAARKRASYSRTLVLDLAAADQQADRPDRGRAGRVARKLRGQLSESQVAKILRTLSSVRDSAAFNDDDDKGAQPHEDRSA